MTDRMQKLQQLLQRDPEDTFLLYAIALEHKKAAAYPEALDYLHRVIVKDPSYAVAHQQAGQVHELAGSIEAARQAYHEGIRSALAKGDNHAADEMRAALAMLE